MRKIAVLAALLALPACATLPVPVATANRTMLDERAGIGAEVAYTTASKLGTALARAGLIDRATFKALDQKGYTALLATRAAYAAGNASGYRTAIDQVNAAVGSMKGLVR